MDEPFESSPVESRRWGPKRSEWQNGIANSLRNHQTKPPWQCMERNPAVDPFTKSGCRRTRTIGSRMDGRMKSWLDIQEPQPQPRVTCVPGTSTNDWCGATGTKSVSASRVLARRPRLHPSIHPRVRYTPNEGHDTTHNADPSPALFPSGRGGLVGRWVGRWVRLWFVSRFTPNGIEWNQTKPNQTEPNQILHRNHPIPIP
mmetsp:Transcript_8539/g.16480  ORF Transcript_8539/g.16480 Transcript_8539/m.16480 type:complete len:201 (-) Transcript_8539:141-743(-)